MVNTPARSQLTLRAAHEQMFRAWPGRDAPRTAWLAFYRRAVQLYGQAAKVDPGHRHEAQFWAGQAAESLRKLETGDE